MAKSRKMCYDKILLQDIRRPQRSAMVNGRSRAIALKGKSWINGSAIKISFLNGTAQQMDMVKRVAPEWTKHANLEFEFVEQPNAQIRVTFNANDGAWSYVGTDNSSIPIHAATLNLGWQDDGVILHEFGHMIGLSHEHQNPEGGIQWNEEVVFRELSGPPNFWDEDTIRHNVLNKYSVDQVNGTDFDEDSVMLYEFPPEWTTNGVGTHGNDDLSKIDKAFVKSAKMYPPSESPAENAVNLAITASIQGEISAEGEVDLYKFIVEQPGIHTIQTMGSTDVVMELYGPDSETDLIAQNDDGGLGRNALISAALQKGTYYVQVRHYSETLTGNYNILVNR